MKKKKIVKNQNIEIREYEEMNKTNKKKLKNESHKKII